MVTQQQFRYTCLRCYIFLSALLLLLPIFPQNLAFLSDYYLHMTVLTTAIIIIGMTIYKLSLVDFCHHIIEAILFQTLISCVLAIHHSLFFPTLKTSTVTLTYQLLIFLSFIMAYFVKKIINIDFQLPQIYFALANCIGEIFHIIYICFFELSTDHIQQVYSHCTKYMFYTSLWVTLSVAEVKIFRSSDQFRSKNKKSLKRTSKRLIYGLLFTLIIYIVQRWVNIPLHIQKFSDQNYLLLDKQIKKSSQLLNSLLNDALQLLIFIIITWALSYKNAKNQPGINGIQEEQRFIDSKQEKKLCIATENNKECRGGFIKYERTNKDGGREGNDEEDRVRQLKYDQIRKIKEIEGKDKQEDKQ